MSSHRLGDPMAMRGFVTEIAPIIDELVTAAALAECDQIVTHWRAAGWPDLSIGVVLGAAVRRRSLIVTEPFDPVLVALRIIDRS